MKTYTLKSVARRGSMLAAAFAIVIAAVAPAASTYADALNPLTERSLALSSSSPGWSNKDGSGNTTYAQPGSGANGEKTGNTFAFRVSSDSSTTPLKGITFQYCTFSAGNCIAPGNNDGTAGTRAVNGAAQYALKHSDLDVVTSTPTELSTGNYTALINATTGQPIDAASVPNRDDSQGNFVVMYKDTVGDSWSQSTGWEMASSSVETTATTGKKNFITLSNETGMNVPATAFVKIIFFATDGNYITNPGSDAFFVKINSYKSDTTFDQANLVDGGVTVANIMNRSIEIQTKVLETMDFSVGTVDPNTLESDGTNGSQYALATGRQAHSICDAILPSMLPADTANTLQLGDADGEFSLSTSRTYSTHSYWRLSSNSSAGATVYYSGVTLSNTVNDKIDAIGKVAKAPAVGGEQFGLALDNGTSGDYEVSYDKERTAGFLYQNGADNAVDGIDASLATDISGNLSYHAPRLAPLLADANYDGGTGNVNLNYAGGSNSIDTSFAFDEDSNLVPTPIASESTDVVDCVTGKMRYIANIAATTPAGIYTTKINYIASPQY